MSVWTSTRLDSSTPGVPASAWEATWSSAVPPSRSLAFTPPWNAAAGRPVRTLLLWSETGGGSYKQRGEFPRGNDPRALVTSEGRSAA